MREHPDPQRGPETAHGEGCASTSADRKLLKSATVPPAAKPPLPTVACSCVHTVRIERSAGVWRQWVEGGRPGHGLSERTCHRPCTPPPSSCRHGGSRTCSPIRRLWPGSMWRPAPRSSQRSTAKRRYLSTSAAARIHRRWPTGFATAATTDVMGFRPLGIVDFPGSRRVRRDAESPLRQ